MMKANVLLAVSALSVLSASAALPIATQVDYRRGAKGKAVVTYTLDRPAVVTFDVQTNGVSIGRANLQSVSGDVYKLMPAGPGRIVWNARTDWSGHRIDDGSLAFVVYAWDVTDKPDYMVVDLSDNVTDRVRYYPTEAEIPGGLLANPIYRTTSLVMKRVHASGWTWMMGGELDGSSHAKDANHLVTLNHDYYMGVFEVTQKQWSLIYGDANKATFVGDNRPMETVRYDWIRNADYPDPPADDTFLALLNARTGIAFDLPSEAEWEFAARAGTAFGCYNTGVTFKDPLYEIPGQTKDSGTETAVVGSFAPNPWGFYDFHGNVSEICLDWYKEDIVDLNGAVCTDSTSQAKALRGGSVNDAATSDRHRISVRNSTKTTTAAKQTGFRLCARDGLN